MSLKQDLIKLCHNAFDEFLSVLSKYDVGISPDLKIIYEDCFFCYYDVHRKLISFSIPDLDTIQGKLQWYYLSDIHGAASVDELAKFGRLAISRIVSHEIAHHLRDFYKTATNNDWMEEHVANAVASAYTHDMYADHSPFLKDFLQRAVAKLKELGERKIDVGSSYHDLGELLLHAGVIGENELQEAITFSKTSKMPLQDVVIARKIATQSQLNEILGKQKSVAGYFNSNYMASFIEYGYFHWAWFLADLEKSENSDLGETVNKYILNNDYEKRCRDESKLILLRSIKSFDSKHAESAAKLLINELDKNFALEILQELHLLPDNTQPLLFRAILALIPGERVEQYCRDSLKQDISNSLRVELLLALYSVDPLFVSSLLNSYISDNDNLILALDVLRVNPIQSFRSRVIELTRSTDNVIRKGAWYVMDGYNPTAEERTFHIRDGLTDADPEIRSHALKYLTISDPSELDKYLSDSDEKVRLTALQKLSPFASRPVDLLQKIDFSTSDYQEILRVHFSSGSRTGTMSDEFIKWGNEHIISLKQFRTLAKNGSSDFSRTLIDVLDDEISAWTSITLTHWLYVNNKADLLSLVPFLYHNEPKLREYTIKIFKINLSPELKETFFADKKDISIDDQNRAVLNIYDSSNKLLRSIIALSVFRKWLQLSDNTREQILQRAKVDVTKVVKEVVMSDNKTLPKPHSFTSAEKIVFLKSTDVFREISIEKLFTLAESLIVRNYSKGEVVVSQGEIGDTLFLIISGKVGVETKKDDGIVLQVTELDQGKAFGEMSILDRQVRSATVRALEDTKCLSLNGDDFRRLAKEDPDLVIELASMLSRRLRKTMEFLESSKV
ncbi:MAG: cyclic nucleotide-binding domain-containing protein [Planctomycetes bacterium]|nr:cyclic nucleotide-binding domain-containing protein [Planctomycetota bacterium]